MNALVHALARMARSIPVPIIIVTVLLTGVFGALAGQQELDQSQESFSPDNEELAALEFAGEAFEGSTDTLVQVLVEGDDVVSPDGFATIQAVTEAIVAAVPPEQLGGQPGQGPVVSYLAPVQAAAQAGQVDPTTLDDAAFDELFTQGGEQLPPEFAGLADQLIAGDEPTDATAALSLVFLDTDAIVGDATGDEALTRTVDAVQAVADAINAAETPLETNAFAFELFFEPDEDFQTEVGRLFGIAALVIVLILFVVYLVSPRGDTTRGKALRRAAADTGLTLFTILASITWMQGLGVLLGPDFLGIIGAFSPPTQIIPILLIGLGVDYAIHLTSRYREEVAAGADVDNAMARAGQTVGVALVLATVTTALGFLTNVTNPVPAIRDFGILAAVGIGSAFVMMLSFVPSVRILLDRRAERRGTLPRQSLGSNAESRLSGLMARTSLLAEKAPAAVIAVTVLLGGLGAYGLTQLSTEFSFADFVPADSPVRQTFLTIEDEFGGGFGERTSVVIEGDVATAEVHNATAEAVAALADDEGVLTFGGQAAADSPVATLQQVVGVGLMAQGGAPAGDPASQPAGADAPAGGSAPDPSQLPFDPAAAAQVTEVAMANGFDPQTGSFAPDADVAAVYDALLAAVPSAGSVLARDGAGDYIGSQVVVQTQSSEVGALELRDAIAADFAPVEAGGPEVTPTGNAIVSEVIVSSLSDSQVSSLGITLAAALLLLVVTFGVRERRPVLGVLTIAPVALVVLWVFGTMAATGIPFGPVTAMISALAIGIGVPFTIHITHRFTEDLERLGDIDESLRSTMRHTGGALAGSALTTMAGFVVLVTSSLIPFRQLGLVTAYAIGYSLLAAVIVLPSLLALWARWHQRRGEPAAVVHHEVIEV